MALTATVVSAVAAVGALGVATYSAFTQPKAPDIPAPPPPSGYIEYDEDGNIAGSQVYENGNWVYRPAPVSEEKKAERKAIAEIRQKTLDNLNNTPAEWETAKKEYVAAFKSQAQETVDEQYKKTSEATDEQMNARGMYGSRAYVDALKENTKEKLEADTDVAEKATLAGEQLLTQRKADELATLNAMNSTDQLNVAQAYQKQAQANNTVNQANATQAGLYAANNSNILNKWQTQATLHNAQTQTLSNTATGLAFLYGYGSKGGGASSLTSAGSVGEAGMILA